MAMYRYGAARICPRDQSRLKESECLTEIMENQMAQLNEKAPEIGAIDSLGMIARLRAVEKETMT